ncbi:MAG: PLP-dependent aminotransferase family protein [Eubacteriales bacterium]|nr:PLP-dependent aminotransferase family protein [Eubacteriales bacterium]
MLIELDREGGEPIRLQIYRQIKNQILSGELREQEPLPSTRQLADSLGVSRSTTVEAYDMLLSEGFLISRQGAPTLVAEGLVIARENSVLPSIHETEPKSYLADFQTGRPDLHQFPRALWQKLLSQTAATLTPEQYGYTGPQGYLPLREEIAAWLGRNRGFLPNPEDIFITAGATHALRILTDVLCSNGGSILIEDPCHIGLYDTLKTCECAIRPIPADDHGMQTDCLPEHTDARAVYITPSHQFPLGGILPAQRRAALLRYAKEQELYIIEDDYDSEFRFAGAPVAPLYAMDSTRVIYVGTFSKTVFPALRIGFAVLPGELQAPWRNIRTHHDVQNPLFEQAALAEFLKTRKLDRHIRVMKHKYEKRRQALLDALKEEIGDVSNACGDAAGLHVTVRFTGAQFGEAFLTRCKQAGIRVATLEKHSIEKGRNEDALVLGYGHMEPETIREAVRLLSIEIRQSM